MPTLPSFPSGLAALVMLLCTALTSARASAETPAEQYERQYIGFNEAVVVSAQTGTVVSQWTAPYEGKYKKPLQGAAFYKKVGREDLALAYTNKMSLKTTAGIAGGAAIVGSSILLITAFSAQGEDCDALSPGFNACFSRERERFDRKSQQVLIGVGLSGAGIAALWLAMAIDPHPVTASEARELADDYNQRLKADLGLSDEGKPLRSRSHSIQAWLTPVLRPDGAGLLLSGAF